MEKLVKYSDIMEPKVSSPYSKQPGTFPCTEPDRTNPILISILDDPF